MCNFISVTSSWYDRRHASFDHSLTVKTNLIHNQLTREALLMWGIASGIERPSWQICAFGCGSHCSSKPWAHLRLSPSQQLMSALRGLTGWCCIYPISAAVIKATVELYVADSDVFQDGGSHDNVSTRAVIRFWLHLGTVSSKRSC